MRIRRIALPLLAAGALVLSACSSGAGGPGSSLDSDYPSRDITLVVPLAAGGSTDSVARVLAEYLGDELGVSINVENQPGAGGVVATTALAHEPADGYTLQYSADTLFSSQPLLTPKLAYSAEDFDFIEAIGGNSPTLVVPEDSPYSDLDQLAAQRFFEVSGVTAQQIPFEGGGAALNAVLAGDVDAYISPETTVVPYIGEGVRALAVSSAARSPFLPDVPTMSELGYDVVLDSLSGVYGPKGLSPDVLTRLEDAMDALAANEDFIADLTDIGIAVIMEPGEYVLDHIDVTAAVYEQLLG